MNEYSTRTVLRCFSRRVDPLQEQVEGRVVGRDPTVLYTRGALQVEGRDEGVQFEELA